MQTQPLICDRCTRMWCVTAASLIFVAMAAGEATAQMTHDVNVGLGSSFSPADLTIQTGDTVRWTWISGEHNVVSGEGGNPDGNFNSSAPINDPGLTFEVTFDQQFLDDSPMPNDTYPYYCSVHLIFGMTGTVTVEPAKTPCPSDFNGDDAVNVFDLLVLLGDWGACADCASDLNTDDLVNVFDLLILLGAWGECP